MTSQRSTTEHVGDDESQTAIGAIATETALAWIATHVAEVAAGQQQLEDLLAEKQRLLEMSTVEPLPALLEREAASAAALERLRQDRDQWLSQPELDGRLHSLREVAVALGETALVEQLDDARAQAARIQQQNWSHWVLAQRSGSHFDELLGLIARRGETPATYDEDLPGSGGGLLDAAA